MPSIFNLFVEHGRLCVITNGPLKGKLVTIVDIKDHRSALVDGPEDVTGVFRMVMNYNDLALTDIVVDITRGISSEDLAKALKEQDIIAKYNETPRAKRDASAEKRANLSDFEDLEYANYKLKKHNWLKLNLISLSHPINKKDKKLTQQQPVHLKYTKELYAEETKQENQDVYVKVSKFLVFNKTKTST
eukprot:CAMPEP_0117427146 /NCGR_PEP_ID=MMETSP0758-20121206/7070_1 /TAXON_ID=63605 /ORGANISM="Percolomonas cosmopolitus, Strain AE-1 (ATCC 50343)" /LENGTH=188 /DNA_ID=CAMNT_0005212643 /DNA_START=38 /DNA_END=605 /DNA_ORIENTATION=+